MIMVEMLLIEDWDRIENGQVDTSIDVGDYFWLWRKGVRIKQYQIVGFSDINDYILFSHIMCVSFINDKY